MHSLRKGKRGEQEFVNFLKSHGIDARRGRQYKGTPDSPDVISSLPYLHFEVKRTESISIYKVLEKTQSECGNKIPVIAHRRSHKDWIIILTAKDFLEHFIPPVRDE